MRKLFFTITVFTAALAGADNFDNQVASIVLLQDKAIQTELKITEAQRSKLNTYGTQFNNQQKAYMAEMEKKEKVKKGSAKPDQAREFKMVTDLKSKVLSCLSAPQIKRLREISLQAIGVTALGDNTIAAKVGLNATQKKSIQTLLTKGLADVDKIKMDADTKAKAGIPKPTNQKEFDAAQKKYQDRMKNLGPAAESKIEDIRQRTIKTTIAVLTPAQNQIWRTLLGPMFKPKA